MAADASELIEEIVEAVSFYGDMQGLTPRDWELLRGEMDERISDWFRRKVAMLKPKKPGKNAFTDSARAVNESEWEPQTGMHKVQCLECYFWFAAPDLRTKVCPDCALLMEREARRANDQAKNKS